MASVSDGTSRNKRSAQVRSQSHKDGRLLRAALRANALFSAVSGLAFVGLAAPLAAWTGVGVSGVFAVIGAGLLPWGAFLFLAARAVRLRPLARLAIAGDLLWVLGSVLVLATRPVALTAAGIWAIILVADVVALFAVAQYVGLRRLGR
ncbi:MAG: hypothetical protein R3272_05920 [Candidatus Promineifilaceae bacterium]|nr:hypothetical protein [Candidatus Promineifilaceae bacterium]